MFLTEFHPFVWCFNDEFTQLGYDYSTTDSIVEEIEGTYADRKSGIKNKSVSWNHSLSDVFSSLLNRGFIIQKFKEYSYSPYNCFKNTVEHKPNQFQIKGLEEKLPLIYSLVVSKL